jgi:hypothetical protein
MAPAPRAGTYARTERTGTAVVFVFEPEGGGRLVAQSYEPATGTWSRLPRPPLRTATEIAWTGTELLVWSEGSRARPRMWRGAAYDYVAGEWRSIADAPFALNLVSAAWTGTEVVLFGSLLDDRNWAETKTSVGAAYAPVTDTWRRLPPSKLSAQATSAALVAGKLVAWDYRTNYQVYDPVRDRWSGVRPMPLEFSECYPDSEVARWVMFAFFCGHAATFDPLARNEPPPRSSRRSRGSGVWREVHGGPLRERIDGGAGRLRVWQIAEMASSGEAVYLVMEGITVTKRGVACFGCRGAPESFWAFRPSVPPGI